MRRKRINWKEVRFTGRNNQEIADELGCSRQRVAVVRDRYSKPNPIVRRNNRVRAWFAKNRRAIKNMPLKEVGALLRRDTGYKLSKPALCLWRQNGKDL